MRFLVLDARSKRMQTGRKRDILGEKQFGFVKDWLLRWKNELKFVVTSVPFSHIMLHTPLLILHAALHLPLLRSVVPSLPDSFSTFFEAEDQWPRFGYGRKRLLDFIRQEGIGRLLFLAGDVHISHFLELTPKGGQGAQLFQFTSSPIANDVSWNRFQ